LRTLEARVGVHTGELVAYSVETSGKIEYRLVGHTANLAARLEALAPVGSVVTSESTRQLCEGYFELRDLGPMTVKGLSTPIGVYEVTGLGSLQTHFQLAARRGLTRFVGRERELEQIGRALKLALKGEGQVVAVIAEAGTGKSRLFYEFKVTIPTTCKVLEAYSVSHSKASPWLPVLELLRGYFGIQDSDDSASRREKARNALTALDPTLQDALPYLFGLLGIVEGPDPLAQMDPQIKHQRTLDAIKHILLRESLKQPVVVIFEDLHWIDAQTQALLDLLTDGIGSSRVLLLCNYRPEYRHEWTSKSYYAQLRLGPLAGADGATMLAALLGESVELNPLKRLIAERTGGNPFFIEEIIQALFDEGALVRNGAVTLTRSPSQLRLPPTVQGILASRIDRQTTGHKQLLQALAVIGRESSLGLLRQVVTQVDGALEQSLGDLQAGGFIYEQPAATGVEYVFKHALTQEVAYNSLLIERRKQLHERAGRALESLFTNQLDDHLTQLAHHYSHSDNIDKAIEYLGRAGQQAVHRSAYTDAINNLNAAIDLLGGLPNTPSIAELEARLQVALGTALVAIKGHAAAEVERPFNRARQVCEQLDDTRELFPVLFGLWSVYMVRAEYRVARSLAEDSLNRACQQGDHAAEMEAHLRLGVMLWYMGRPRLARQHLESCLRLHDPVRDRAHAFLYGQDPEAAANLYLGLVLWQLGYPGQAVEMSQKGLEAARRLGHPFTLTFALCYSAWLHMELGAWLRFSALADELETLAKSRGFATWTALSEMFQSMLLAGRGQLPRALEIAKQGIEAYVATGAGAGVPMLLAFQAGLLSAMGNGNDALSVLREARELATASSELNGEAELLRFEGQFVLKLKDTASAQNFEPSQPEAKAEESFMRALECSRASGSKSHELRAAISLARLWRRQGYLARARETLAEVYESFTEGFDTADLQQAKALLLKLA
jgi:tetratricopeptide (TPR) repeat protein